MAVCPNCNTVNEEGTKFCVGCGIPMTQQEVQMPAEEVIAQPVVQPVEEVIPEAPAKKKGNKKGLIIGVAIGLVAVVAGGLLIFKDAIFGKNDKKISQVFYVKGDDLMYRDLDAKESVEIGPKACKSVYSFGDYEVVVNKNQTRVFFPDKCETEEKYNEEYDYYDNVQKYNLNYLDLNKKNAEPQKVASKVIRYDINDAGTKVVYLTADNTLYVSDLKEETKIAKDVSDFGANEDISKIVYKEGDTFYLWKGGDDAEEIFSDGMMQYVNDEMNFFVYSDEDGILYTVEEGKDAVKLAENVYMTYGEKDNTFYYATTNEASGSLMDYVQDDLAESDAAMTEPVSPEYPEYPEYPDWDDSLSYEEASAKYEKDKQAYEDEKQRLLDEYEAAKEKYNADYDLWREKQDRDYLRESLKEYSVGASSYSLYYYDGKAGTLVTDSMAKGFYEDLCIDAGLMVITQVKTEEIEKTKLEEIEYAWEFQEEINEQLQGDMSYALVNGKTVTALTLEDVNNIQFSYDGSALWYLEDVDGETGEGTLYKMPLKDKKPGKAEKYDEDVCNVMLAENGDVAYLKDAQRGDYYSDITGTLYINKTKIEKDVGNFVYLKDSWIYETDSEDGIYTLNICKDGKGTKIEKEVSDYGLSAKGELVYIADSGKLYAYENGKPVELDKKVSTILNVTYK